MKYILISRPFKMNMCFLTLRVLNSCNYIKILKYKNSKMYLICIETLTITFYMWQYEQCLRGNLKMSFKDCQLRNNCLK